MCGIAGLYAYLDVAPSVDRAELARMNARMALRGPDGSGDWFSADGRVGFTHRRLAIIPFPEAATLQDRNSPKLQTLWPFVQIG